MTATAERVTWEDLRESSKGVVNPRAWARAVRNPGRSMKELVGNGPVFPLLILFGLNAADELDRTGFGDPPAERPRRLRHVEHRHPDAGRVSPCSVRCSCRCRSRSPQTGATGSPSHSAAPRSGRLFSLMTGFGDHDPGSS